MKNFLIILLLSFSVYANAQYSMNPAPVSGEINLNSVSATVYFTNFTSTPMVPNFSLVQNGFTLLNRCAGKTLNRNQNCYIRVSINDTLLSGGDNLADLKDNGITLFQFRRTKIQGSGSSSFVVSSMTINDFIQHSVVIKNQTQITQNYSPIFSGVDASKYEIVLNRCQNVISNGSCTISIKMKPQLEGSYSATFGSPSISNSILINSVVTTGSSGGGTLVPPTESISPSSSSLDLGTITRFGVTGYRNLIITNSGNSPISPIISLNSPMVKIALNRCIGIILPNRSCSVYVYLNILPTEGNGIKTGLSLDVKTSPLATPQVISISANLQVPGNGPQIIGPSPIQLVNEVYSVSVGSYHSCALDANGIARCWGWGAYGKLGSISFNGTSNPIPLYLRMDLDLSGKTIAGIAASGWQTCSMTTDSKLFCQGYNGTTTGALGINSNVLSRTNPTEIYMGGALLGKTIKSASSGYASSCIIASDDYVYCWGDGYNGGIGTGATTNAGSVFQPVKVNGLIQNIQMKQIAKNGYGSCSLSLDDRLFCWGNGSPVPAEIVLPNSEKAKFISLGSSIDVSHSCAITQSNKVYCWSGSFIPFLITTNSGDTAGKNFTKIVSGNLGAECLISDDNLGFCFNAYNPTVAPALIDLCKAPFNKTVKSIGLGQFHSCSSTMDNEVYCWGQNNFGQLGDGSLIDSASPVLVNFN